MRQQRYLSVLFILYFVIIFFSATSIRAQEVEDEREFDYGENSEKGPKMWGKLKKEWDACKNGEMQSPIDMSHERVRIIRKPEKRHYKTCNATVKNRGHDISVQWHGDAGSVLINGTNYPLQQAHWHSPSEHTVNGRRYEMEMHMVHLNENATNKIAVTAVLYKIGKPDPFLSKLIRNISSMIDKKDEVKNAGMIDPREIKIGSRKYYRYMGSLTVPPCTEGVIWTIKKKVRTVSRDQVKMLREAVHDYAERNTRPLQPINKRPIYLMAPEDTA